MVWNIIKNMFDNTDNTGILIIRGWNVDPEETTSNPRFYKCLMNWKWEDVDSIAEEATLLCSIIELIGRYCAEKGLDINCEPDFYADFDEEDAEEYQEVWEMFFGGYDINDTDRDKLAKIAEERLGRAVNAYNVFIRVRRLLRVISLGAPDIIVNSERFELVRAIVLNCACEGMVCVDISKDRFDTKAFIIGEFNEADIERIFEIVCKDCSVIPEESMGYTVLVNMIFGSIRIDLYRSYDRLKPAVDTVLGTLTDNERTVLEKRYGLNDGVRKSYETIALEMCMPKPIIEWYETSAMQKLRHPNRASKLEMLFHEPENDDGMAVLDNLENGGLTEDEQAFLDSLSSPMPDDFPAEDYPDHK